MENSSDQKQEKPQHLVGLFKDQSSAAKAYHVLTGLDYSSDKITFVISEEKYKSDQMVTKTVETIPQDAQSGPDNEGDEYMKSTRALKVLPSGQQRVQYWEQSLWLEPPSFSPARVSYFLGHWRLPQPVPGLARLSEACLVP